MYRVAVVFALALLLSIKVKGEIVLVKSVTYSDMAMLLEDKKLIHRRVQLVCDSGRIVNGKMTGFSNGKILLQDAPPIKLCGINLVRISHNAAGRWRRGFASAGGVFGGMLVGAPFVLGIALAGAEVAAVTTYLAFPVMGGWAGSKLSAKREDSVYLLDAGRKSDAPPGDSEVSGSREQMAIVGPDLMLTYIQRSRQVNRIARPQRNTLGKASDQRDSPAQQRIGNGYQIPEIALHMPPENIHQFTALRQGECSFSHMTMKNRRHFEERPRR